MKKIAVLGAGTMGSGIAQIAATNGHTVTIYEMDKAKRVQARDKLLKILNRLVEKGRLDDHQAKAIFGRIYFVDNLESLSDADIVFEAIIENLKIKGEVFKKLEGIVSADTILATNTSSLSVSAISAFCDDPSRCVGAHFFNPPPLMKLVEIIPAKQSSDETVRITRNLIENWGKLTVMAKDTPGFIVNRVARPFYGEALRIYEEGLASPLEIDTVMKTRAGFRMGPFELMDYIGHDVNYKVTETVWNAFYNDPRYKPSFAQKDLVSSGYLGRKSGQGFYTYINGKAQIASVEVSAEKSDLIYSRILSMLVNEASDALYFGVASAEDIELAMTKGVNYPKGLLAWGNILGLEKVVSTLDGLNATYKEGRYRASPLLRKMIEKGHKFLASS